MDWPSHLDSFLSNCENRFNCGFEAKNNVQSEVLQVFGTDGSDFEVQNIDLKEPKHWKDWFECPIFSDGEELILPSDLPEDGVCILFIPRTEDISVRGKDPIPAGLTDLPITKVSFIYEGAAPDKLWMHIAMTSSLGPNNFAIASTHVERVHLTLAIMIGCSKGQIKRVQELVQGSEDAIRHPLLMLGICAELLLDRLKELVSDAVTKGLETTRNYIYLYTLEATRDDTTRPNAYQHKGDVTWDLINQVRARRDQSRRVEEEVKTTKRQLSKALPPALGSLIDRSENNDYTDNKDDRKKNDSVHELDQDDEVTNMFTERFADIFDQFDILIAECRISVEDMSFSADMIRSELARPDSKRSAQLTRQDSERTRLDNERSIQEAKRSTVIAFVAMLYLPMTAVATIFSMPVFQFTYDWRDWRFYQVNNSNTTTSPEPPVFSGYFWIYFGISISFTLITILGWWRFTESPKGGHTSGSPGSMGSSSIKPMLLTRETRSFIAKQRSRISSWHWPRWPRTQLVQPEQRLSLTNDGDKGSSESKDVGTSGPGANITWGCGEAQLVVLRRCMIWCKWNHPTE
ncbi:hypothetical protein L207DRAFT_559805 [Hyaloscypha variabilis F]|uniref:Cora-domain-containing protein n=1 Tax=Hyaloscypha variabilis (strain UAMH 11265 / GT02V1 / F) TaxID=1149755 RepID=A0A2J6SBC3_HYAVF|nr:hypothetical protein L207DRAFT_559805 [Hyaloscypha variabilis F]